MGAEMGDAASRKDARAGERSSPLREGAGAGGGTHRRKRVAILGATGSIGTQALDVIARHPDRYEVVALVARSSAEKLLELARVHRPRYLGLTGNANMVLHEDTNSGLTCGTDAVYIEEASTGGPDASSLTDRYPLPEGVAWLPDPMISAVELDIDAVIVATVGMSALRAVLRAIELGRDVLLATKEVLVAGGALVKAALCRSKSRLIPIDSEHSAIFQCIQAGLARPDRIVLTASGGPLRTWSPERIASASLADVLNHPTWTMGRKITVDSASMANKGLEVIEAHWLFDMPPEAIEVVVHPQSIVHSAVSFPDGAMLAQLGVPDMRAAIGYALSFPERLETGVRPLDLLAAGHLTFEPPDETRFPCLALAFEALRRGGAGCCVYNAANEAAVDLFLKSRISFVQIPLLIQNAMDTIGGTGDSLEGIERADRDARRHVYACVQGGFPG